ncbi:MFS transporter [Mycetocola miduiensis]|uniref:MFS transporter, putative metabolite:H+ symporter n=1 Tax=Mycetocola miduiensis TaxID=995034 RepID=A0A1I5BLR8_9MICO|nr:MFS transporter [Mycetocola miduiensis]SFN75421.1 MFS transporter, putative metabolite:H+ symporter [Mycetocola miduiensis]
MSETERPTTRLARLDALPFTKEHRKLLVGSGMGWALDAMDVGLISFVLAQLAVTWSLTGTELSWIASAGFIGMAIGASLGGLLADRFGRRQVFAITLLVFGVATGASALAWSVGALIALRFLVGLGLGAELPVASTLVSEFAPPRIRGRVIVLLEAFWAVGWTLAAIIGFVVVPASAEGWRWALAIGAVPAVYAAVVRFGLPESVRFLESRGRVAEAEATVQRFERSAGVKPPDQPLPLGDAPTQPRVRAGRQVAALWARPHRVQTAALWLVWFCVNFAYYGAFVWLPTILVASGFSLVRSFGYTLIITLAQLPGYLVAAWLVEKWGRNRTLAVFLAGSAVSAVLFGLAGAEWQVIGAGMLLSFFNLGAWGALYAVTPELYPTALRATGSGWAAGVGRIASILAPLAVPLLTGVGGNVLLFSVFAVFFLIAAGAALALADKRGKSLDDVVPPELARV